MTKYENEILQLQLCLILTGVLSLQNEFLSPNFTICFSVTVSQQKAYHALKCHNEESTKLLHYHLHTIQS